MRMYNIVLTHLFPIHPFSAPRKHQKTVRLSDVLRGLREGALGTNALIVIEWLSERIVRKKMDISQHFVWQLCVGLVEYSLFLRNLFSRRQKFDKDTIFSKVLIRTVQSGTFVQRQWQKLWVTFRVL